MTNFKTALLAGGLALLASVGAAQAGSYGVTVETGATGGNGFVTGPTAPSFTGAVASATFTYTGAINFTAESGAAQNFLPSVGDLNSSFGFTSPSISGYVGSGTVSVGGTQIANFGSLGSFLNSSGSAGNYAYASWYRIDLGVLAAGTQLTITHDDGVSVYQGASQMAGLTAGPTSQITEMTTLGGSADTILYYSRQNGAPSVLSVSVPEPVSLSLLGAGLLGLGLVRRRKHSAG